MNNVRIERFTRITVGDTFFVIKTSEEEELIKALRPEAKTEKNFNQIDLDAFVTVNDILVRKCCDTCKYQQTHKYEPDCCLCNDYSHWKPFN